MAEPLIHRVSNAEELLFVVSTADTSHLPPFAHRNVVVQIFL
jgi:hypothetical protein